MNNTKESFISKKDVDPFYKELRSGYKVYRVKKKGPHYVFGEAPDFWDPGEEYIPTILPPKKYLQPQEETLFCMALKPRPSLTPKIEAPPQVIFGVRPCDITGISLMDKVFFDANVDPYYKARRENTVIIGIDCLKPCDEDCFCSTVGSLDVKEGFDLLLTDIGEGYFVTVGTPRGEKLLKDFSKARESSKKERELFLSRREGRKKEYPYKFKTELSSLPLLFTSNWEHPVWKEIGDICLACGRCNLVCPTCYCFDTFDAMDVSLREGERRRQWDGCTLAEFAVIAGGINFRAQRSQRLRHRFNRKFNYLMAKHGQSHCVGCGRCYRACLVHIHPVEVVNKLAGGGQ
jgi:ferredoxin